MNTLYYYGLKDKSNAINPERIKGKSNNWWILNNKAVRDRNAELFLKLGINATDLSDIELQKAINEKLKLLGDGFGNIKTDGRFGRLTIQALEILNNNLALNPSKSFTGEIKNPFINYTFNRGEIRDILRTVGINPYDYSGSDRKALRKYLNGDINYRKANIENILNIFGLNKNFEKLNTVLKKGGILNKFQEGGAVDAQQQMEQAFMAYLADKYQTDDINSLVKQLWSTPGETGETKLQDELVEFQQLIQQQLTQTMKNGAKIEYLKSLRGGCPEGYETTYYKKGGQICSKCMKKAEKGTEIPKKKLFFKKQNGGDLNGAPANVPVAKCGGKPKKASCGKKLFKKQNGGILYFN